METSSDDVINRIANAREKIETIRAIGGNAGMSIGVLHHGKVIHRAHFGYRDVENRISADDSTMYHVGSMTKGIISDAVALLVQDGKIAWKDPVHKFVPAFNENNKNIKVKELCNEANIIDLLAHRLGVAAANSYWVTMRQVLLTDRNQTAELMATFEPTSGFREKMTYSNWPYGLVGEIIEDLVGQTAGAFVKQRLFDPLGLENSTLGIPDPENHVKSYISLTDGTPSLCGSPALTDGKVLSACGSCKSSLNDMLIYYRERMRAAELQSKDNAITGSKSPFVHSEHAWKGQIPICDGADYGLGWVVTELPARGGLTGLNGYANRLGVDGLPLIGHGAPKGTRLIYHNGAMNGALSCIYLLPDTHSAVIVLGNSLDLCDTADWVGQLLIEAILGVPEPVDVVLLARVVATRTLGLHPAVQKQLTEERVHDTPVKPLHAYTGKYWNSAGNYFVEIFVHNEYLRLVIQGLDKVHYDLYHYNYDVFAWNCDWNAEARLEIFPFAVLDYHKVDFKSDDKGEIVSLKWGLDGLSAGVDSFTKEK